MKKVAAVIAVIAILAAGLPALLGMLAQNRITRLADAASASRLVRVDVTGYERGWLRSRAVLSMAIHDSYMSIVERALGGDANRTAPPVELRNIPDRVELDIYHGPLLPRGGIGIADVVARMDPATEGLDELLAATMEMQGPVEAAARIGIGRESSYRWTIPPIVYSSPAANYAASGLTGEGTYDYARQHHTGHVRMDSLEFSTDVAGIGVENFTFSMDVARNTNGIWPGSSLMSLDHLSIDIPLNGSTIEVESIVARGQSEVGEAGHLFHNSSEMTAETLTAAVNGNEHIMADLRFDAAARNLDVDALYAYRDWAFDIAGEIDPMAFLVVLEPVIHGALAAEPEFDIGPFGFNWNDDTLQASIQLRIDNEMLPAEPMFSLVDTALWTRLVAVDVELDADRDVAEWIALQAMSRQGALGGSPADLPDDILQAQARGTLVALVAQGMLEETESGYRFRGSYDNGVVEVNGRVVPIGAAAQGLF